MAQSLALNQKGSVIKPFGDTSSGFLSNLTSKLGFSQPTQTPVYPTPTGQPITQGNNSGLISGTNTTNHIGTTTITPDGTKTITTPAKSNASVLAQQKMLNEKYGAGLVEDGIAGPKTSAAIAKYLTGNTGTSTPTTNSGMISTPETPIDKSQAQTQTFPGYITALGNQQESPYNKIATESANAITDLSKINSGTSGKAYEDYQKAIDDLANYKREVSQKLGANEMNPIPLEFIQGRGQVLSRQAAEQLNALEQAVAEKASALGYGIQGAQLQQQGLLNAGNIGLTGQGTYQNALGTAAQYSQPQLGSIGQVPFNPLTQGQGTILGTNQGEGVAGVGALNQQIEQGGETQRMIGAYNQAKPLIETAKQQIKNAQFNVSPLGLVNQLQQYVNKNVLPSGEYANIFNTLSEIATTISPVLGAQGAQTDLKTMIAQEFIPKLLQGQDIGFVLDNIEKNALAKIEANKATSQQSPLQVPSSGTSGGGLYDF